MTLYPHTRLQAIMALAGFLAAIFLFWFFVMGGAVLLFGAPHLR